MLGFALFVLSGCRVVPCRAVPCRAVPYRVILCRVMSCRVASRRVALCRVVSCRSVLLCFVLSRSALVLILFGFAGFVVLCVALLRFVRFRVASFLCVLFCSRWWCSSSCLFLTLFSLVLLRLLL